MMLPQAQQAVCIFFGIIWVVVGNVFVIFGVDGIVFVIFGFVGDIPCGC
jgi:hypothetical protein